MEQPLRGVTFDWWGTLYRHREARSRRVQRIMEVLSARGLQVTLDEVEAAYLVGAETFDQEWRAGRAYSSEGWLKQILDQMRVDIPESERAALRRYMEEVMLEHPPEMVPGAKSLLHDLHAAGVKLGIVSDTGLTVGRVMRRILELEGVLDCFQGLSFSDEVGVTKPNPIAFRRALDAMGVRPEEAVHVGDLCFTDMKGAKAMGMRAVLITGVSGTEDDGQADAVVKDFAELRQLFEEWGLLPG
ncbi:MAG: HAD family hydrolase [Anaerolineae bacterium]